MMRKPLWIALVATLVVAPSALADLYRTPADVERLVVARKDSLQTKYHLNWPEAPPHTRVGMPYNNWLAGIQRAAMYTFDDDSLFIHPVMVADPDSLTNDELDLRRTFLNGDVIDAAMVEIVDHELIHAFITARHQALFGKRTTDLSKLSSQELETYCMVSEGLAMIATGDSTPDTPDDWWPETLDIQNWADYMHTQDWWDMTYLGGARLMLPLVHRFGLGPTVDYALMHPIHVHGKQFRRAILRWRARAELELSKQTQAPH